MRIRIDFNDVKIQIITAPNTTAAVWNVHVHVLLKAGIDPDDVESLDGYVTCNRATWKMICNWFMEKEQADNLLRPREKQVMPGGPWLNWGFSTTNGEELKDGWVELPAITMKRAELCLHD